MRDEETGSAASLTLLVWQGLVLDIYIAPNDDTLRPDQTTPSYYSSSSLSPKACLYITRQYFHPVPQ